MWKDFIFLFLLIFSLRYNGQKISTNDKSRGGSKCFIKVILKENIEQSYRGSHSGDFKSYVDFVKKKIEKRIIKHH